MLKRHIPFTRPDITSKEIKEVVNTLKSGWIITGPKTKQFENEISKYCNVEKTVCLSSATMSLDMVLKLFEIDENDEIITTPYTFASTCNEILHSKAKLVFVDINKDFNIDPEKLNKAITKKTKVIIPTDIAGYPCDYDKIIEILNKHKKIFKPKKNSLQKYLEKPLLISDSAHSFGAIYNGKKIGCIADFTIFSFHATKNITTAEGGAITFNSLGKFKSNDIYNRLMMLSLHGQNKDAMDKLKLGGWKYSIELPGFKCNMPDILASLGLSQLKRYDKILEKRKVIFNTYINQFNKIDKFIMPPYKNFEKESSYHLFLLRIKNITENQRDLIIDELAKKSIACNVHFIPVVMQPFYKKLGFNINNFPNSYNMYKNEITLPLSSLMNKKDAIYVASNIIDTCKELNII